MLTQLDEIWKTTSIFLKMEDDLNFSKWKTTFKPKHILGLAKLSKILLPNVK